MHNTAETTIYDPAKTNPRDTPIHPCIGTTCRLHHKQNRGHGHAVRQHSSHPEPRLCRLLAHLTNLFEHTLDHTPTITPEATITLSGSPLHHPLKHT
eukprot:1152708-Pelagomonas_calceolata.AAC.6